MRFLHTQPSTGGVGEEQSHRTNQVDAPPHTSYRWERRESLEPIKVDALTTHQLQVERRERDIEPIKCMTLTTTPSYRLRGRGKRRHRANQVDALTTNQLQVERRERVIEPIKWMRSHTHQLRWRGESHRTNKWMLLPHHQLQVERRES